LRRYILIWSWDHNPYPKLAEQFAVLKSLHPTRYASLKEKIKDERSHYTVYSPFKRKIHTTDGQFVNFTFNIKFNKVPKIFGKIVFP
jgi:hypothetical protein